MANFSVFRTLSALTLLITSFGFSANAATQAEVVQSVPVETTLTALGIRTTQQVWLEMINAAKKTIDLEEFYIYSQPGQSLAPVLDAVRAAANRGVKVRFLIDSKFYKTYPTEPNQLNQTPNIEVRQIDYSQHGGGVQHSKYFVVDQSEAFVGSANFDWLALSHIHEVGLRIPDSQVSLNLEMIFSRDWESGMPVTAAAKTSVKNPVNERKSKDVSTKFQLVASPPSDTPDGIPDTLTAIIKLLDSAKSSLKIQLYQYTTKLYKGSGRWTVLDSAIRKAASRGVKVKILVDVIAMKKGSTDLKALAALNNVDVRTVTIPAWSGGPIPYARLIHSKYLTVDNTSAWVGSENWSDNYFTASRNVGVTFQSAEITGKLNQIFDIVWNSAYITEL